MILKRWRLWSFSYKVSTYFESLILDDFDEFGDFDDFDNFVDFGDVDNFDGFDFYDFDDFDDIDDFDFDIIFFSFLSTFLNSKAVIILLAR